MARNIQRSSFSSLVQRYSHSLRHASDARACRKVVGLLAAAQRMRSTCHNQTKRRGDATKVTTLCTRSFQVGLKPPKSAQPFACCERDTSPPTPRAHPQGARTKALFRSSYQLSLSPSPPHQRHLAIGLSGWGGALCRKGKCQIVRRTVIPSRDQRREGGMVRGAATVESNRENLNIVENGSSRLTT